MQIRVEIMTERRISSVLWYVLILNLAKLPYLRKKVAQESFNWRTIFQTTISWAICSSYNLNLSLTSQTIMNIRTLYTWFSQDWLQLLCSFVMLGKSWEYCESLLVIVEIKNYEYLLRIHLQIWALELPIVIRFQKCRQRNKTTQEITV